ncbi:MAG TPA: type II toxin-antitoxin system VapC family toxin [Bacillota bacterium]|nr:type II toxin-antitoxin system VapC family toxin [Bacillota bacterium]
MTARPWETVVLDASVALAWVLPGDHDALALRDRACDAERYELVVPPTFWFEVTNALWVATRRGRLDGTAAAEALASLEEFAIDVWLAEPARCLSLALEFGVAAYDAACLAIALDRPAILWTLDARLAEVAAGAGVETAPAR